MTAPLRRQPYRKPRQPTWANTSLEARAQRKALRISTQARRVARAYRVWERNGLQVNSARFMDLHRAMLELRRLIRSSEDGPL